MKILNFRIENFRNLAFAECTDVPNLVVLCGSNGCGKSALLEALMTAKEHAGSYGNFNFDARAVSADADVARISMEVAFSEHERNFVDKHFNTECPEKDEIVIEINKTGQAKTRQKAPAVGQLFGFFSKSLGSPGFFDFIDAHRVMPKQDLKSWEADFLSDERAKKTLASGQNKFQLTKQYLAALKMQHLQNIQQAIERQSEKPEDPLKEIKTFFDEFFAPMEFDDVYIYDSPFQFVVKTPQGNVDIDDLSSGEKEILNTYIRFHQLNPNGAVILFDEVDAHLHPDLERRYLEVLRKYSTHNQLILTTHSPEMMMAAGTDSLYTLLKEPQASGDNQLVRVTHDEELHSALSELMGSKGLVSFNQRIVFIEGEDTSADREIFEYFYPPNKYNISFVPAGDSETGRGIAEKVNLLLASSVGFQEYYSIVDGDIAERFTDDPTSESRLQKLPVYHVENFLLDEQMILSATETMLGTECPYESSEEVGKDLCDLILADNHINAFTRALLDAKVARAARHAYEAVFQKNSETVDDQLTVQFTEVREEAKRLLSKTVNDGTWKERCKGRELLRSYCGKHNIKYHHFKNVLLNQFEETPVKLQKVMKPIIDAE